MPILSLFDIVALGFFITCWLGYGWLLAYSPWKRKSLSYLMDEYRYGWMKAMLAREVRIPDTNISAGLQQGTAFFASASLLALGGAFAILNSTEKVVQVMSDLPFTSPQDASHWELKAFGLIAIVAYSFFKFGWAYRLFNYTTIVMGSIPDHAHEDNPHALAASKKAARLATLAGRHFSRGQQSLFFAVGYLGWYAGPWALIATTICVTGVLVRRQYFSKARRAVVDPPVEHDPA
ncbi:DUF599 family protein [Rhodobacteraceae bacterium RKSG542]|uniref:DUF599 domain-containing protein n=1 Tax=Pseudovibrio flavus TaxID=2529854 RepID=UPI00352816C7|nr:DUF599 family protein [Pseudovibrio flavus]